jgi:death-on-curing protein
MPAAAGDRAVRAIWYRNFTHVATNSAGTTSGRGGQPVRRVGDRQAASGYLSAPTTARNHPLPDGNKRLAWGCLTIFCLLNGRDLHVEADDAVDQMLGVAAGEIDEAAMAAWLAGRLAKAD